MAFHSLHHSLSTYAICTIKNLPHIRALQDKVQGNFLPLACNISFISFYLPYQLLICLFGLFQICLVGIYSAVLLLFFLFVSLAVHLLYSLFICCLACLLICCVYLFASENLSIFSPSQWLHVADT